MRLFVSVDLDGLEDEIATVQEHFADTEGVRLTAPENVHITLKFLGEVAEADVPDLTTALAAAVDESSVDPFQATFGGLGAFPSAEYIRVLWVGVREGSTELTRLHEAIETSMTDIGFDPADHDFTPHATIARMDHAGGKERVQRTLESTDPTIGALDVESVRLTESTLEDDGPEYATVEQFDL